MKQYMKRCMAAATAAAMLITLTPSALMKAWGANEETVGAKETEKELVASYVFEEGDVTDKTIADTSGNGFDATLEGVGASVSNGMLTLPGGAAGSSAAYVSIPGEVFEGRNTLTVTVWLKNQTGSGNYAGMFFGTPSRHIGGGTSDMPLNYWLLNPAQPDGYFKSVWTDSNNEGAPYSTETPVSGTKTGAEWAMYTTVITPNKIIGYYNGAEVCSNSKSKSTEDFGTGLVSYIGRSGYNDIFYKGGVYGVKVYQTALTQREIWEAYYGDMPSEADQTGIISAGIQSAKADLDLGDISGVTTDLQLPAEGSNGASISWESSQPSVISNEGEVHRDSSRDVDVILTARITIGKQSDTKEFKVKVKGASKDNLYEELLAGLSVDAIVMGDIELPGSPAVDITVSWTSSNPKAIALKEEGASVKGTVVHSDKEQKLNLTVQIVYDSSTGRKEVTRTYPVIVPAKAYGYLMSYTNWKENASLGNSLHLAYSKDGSNYTALNSNTGVCFANNADGRGNSSPNGLRDMYLFRKADGSYGLVAKNVGNSEKYIYVYDSEDLTEFTNERRLSLDYAVAGGLQVKAVSYDADDIRYEIYWSDGSKTYRAVTKDFARVLEQAPAVYQQENKDASGSLPEGTEIGNIISLGQAEYERVTGKFDVVKNIGMKSIDLELKDGNNAASLMASQKVTALYSDGTEKDMSVDWDSRDIAKIDVKKPGTYTVKGTVKQMQYPNPFIEQRADPCILKGNDGYYYFTASYPVCGAEEERQGIGYDRIAMRRSKTIEGLQNAEEIAIWECKNSDDEFRYIWAPEIRLVKDNYYVFYTSSIERGSSWGIRPHVLKCTNPDDIMNPASWTPMGIMQAKATDRTAFSNFSLDMTVFENQGRWYVIWAQTVGNSSLLMAEINPDNPVECISDSVLITKPEYAWERQVVNVNEGPSVIKNNGKIYVAYSASGTGPEYCVGLLSIDENANLLDASAWKKQAYPVLTSSDVPGEYGPGHNSFTVDEEGNPIFVYHARSEECYQNKCQWASSDSLYDPCRQARLKRVHWAIDGTPILKMSYEEELAEENRRVTAKIIIKQKPVSTNPSVSKVKLNKTKLTLGVKESFTLSAVVTPKNAVNRKVSWSMSKKGIVTVSSKGVVKAKKKGSVTITAKAGGKKATCKVTVKAAPVKITLNAAKKSLKKGKSYQIKVKMRPKNAASNKITYTSNNKKVVTVSKSGKVKAKKRGKANIVVKTFNNRKAKITITVK